MSDSITPIRRTGKILLVSAGADNPESVPESPCMLTMLVLEAALRGADIPADVFFYFGERWPTARQRLLAQLQDRQYDIVGVSFMSYNRLEAYELINDLARIVPHCRVIVGGVHASFLYKQLLREFANIQAVAIGEGEQALVEFCRHPDRLESVPGIAYRDEAGQVKVNPRPPAAGRDLDQSPMINYTLIRDFQGIVPVQTSRGCVGRCVFCSWRMMETTVKTKCPERIAREWAQIREIFGPHRQIAVTDALYNVTLEHVKGMCRALIAAGLTTNPWAAELRAKPMDREMLELMKRAGCKRINIGVETGNETMRRNIGKGVSNKDIERAFALAHEVKMPTFPFLITGLPGETMDTVAETIAFVRSLRPYYFPAIDPPQAYPGSELYARMEKRGLISDEYWLYRHAKNWGDCEAFGNLPLYTVEHNPFELKNWCTIHNHALAGSFATIIPQERIIMDDEEYDRFQPWPVPEIQLRLKQLLQSRLHGTLKGRARRIVRRIKANLQVLPTRLHRRQPLAISLSVWTHRPADVYLVLLLPNDGPALSLVWRDNRLGLSETLVPHAANVPDRVSHYWTEVLTPAPEFYVPGRYALCLIVCGAGESVVNQANWLDWRKRSFRAV